MSNLQEEFIQFVQWLLDDEDRQSWFISLSALPESDKTISLRNKMILLSQSDEDENLIKMMATLSDTENYQSIRAVLLAELNKKQN